MPAQTLQFGTDLATLLQGFAVAPSLPVSGIASDSRKLGKGMLFLACRGQQQHGLDYLDDALQAGVAAVAYELDGSHRSSAAVPMIAVEDLSRHLGEIASRYYNAPSQALTICGVTGTNGKTTVAWMIAQCLRGLGRSCAYLGTLGYGVDALAGGEGLTTPGAVELQKSLAHFVEQGADTAAIEVSSHALSQHRIQGTRIDTAVFTNLSRDHLDYHGDMQAYGEAKASLFLDARPAQAIIDIDTAFGAELAQRCDSDVCVVSVAGGQPSAGQSFVSVSEKNPLSNGWDVRFSSSWGDGRFVLPMPGEFNVSNAAGVLALLLQKGVPVARACELLSQIEAPPGRLQRVPGSPQTPAVYVDYAHTPDALESVLNALRAHGPVTCVFGCGGDRDKGKRPMMGRVAAELADKLVITSDNPRSELPAAIIEDILAGIAHRDALATIENRAAAIAWAIQNAAAGEQVLIAGKGHEQYQIVGEQRIAFSDYRVASASLQEYEPGSGS